MSYISLNDQDRFMRIVKINPPQVYYIKLGAGGDQEQICIESDHPAIWVGFNEIPHEMCISGQWDQVGELLKRNHDWPANMVTIKVKQLQMFYETGEDVLWVAFYRECLWWCFAGKEITSLPNGSRSRPALGGWSSTDIKGQPLETSRLSGSLLSLQGYRGTLCKVREQEYLLRKINAEESPTMAAAQKARDELQHALEAIICSLHWKDFELLVDLIFRQAGWQRVSQLGKTQKTLDLDLFAPVTNERLLVQVKSKADQKTFQEFIAKTGELEAYARCYLIVHTPGHNLTWDVETDTHKIWLPSDIARLVIQYGLTDWVMGKAK